MLLIRREFYFFFRLAAAPDGFPRRAGLDWLPPSSALDMSPTLPLRPGPKLPEDPVFKHPPQWIHEAGTWLLSRREARKRALVRLIDRIPSAKEKKA